MDDLVLRLEQHWLACMASAGGGGTLTRIPGGLVLTNPRSDAGIVNLMLPRQAHAGAPHLFLPAGEAVLAGSGRRPVLLLSPLAGDLGAWGDFLAGRGWRRIGRQTVLAADLGWHQVEPDGTAVRPIGPDRLHTWGQILTDAYEVSPQEAPAIASAWTALLQNPGEQATSRLYLAWVDGRPVGTGLCWSSGGLAGLYCGAVLPPFRRRGAARALLQRRLYDAAQDGDRLAYLQTEEGSPVEHLCLAHLHFEHLYRRELWAPARDWGLIGDYPV